MSEQECQHEWAYNILTCKKCYLNAESATIIAALRAENEGLKLFESALDEQVRITNDYIGALAEANQRAELLRGALGMGEAVARTALANDEQSSEWYAVECYRLRAENERLEGENEALTEQNESNLRLHEQLTEANKRAERYAQHAGCVSEPGMS